VTKPVSLVIPVRAFDDAKSRLAEVLSPRERRDLASACARRVIGSIPGADVFVVCDDDEVARFAQDLGASAIRVDVDGLNAALTAGVPQVRTRRPMQPVIVAHADLPFVDRLRELWNSIADDVDNHSLMIVPDRHRMGSNVVIIGCDVLDRWRFAYGERSFSAHLDQARDLGIEAIVIDDEMLSLDLDTPQDLDDPRVMGLLDQLLPNRRPT
jgi:2-phospho-L-lactate guanylyltransferase